MDSASQRPAPTTRRWWKVLSNAVAGPSWFAVIFVWGSWALILLGALANVKVNGTRFPYWDDWGRLPYAVGKEPITLGYLWEQDSDHREPFLKLLYFGSIRLSKGDYRAYAFFTCIVAGGLAFALIRAARTLRSWTSCTDAFFPVILLQPAFVDFLFLDAWGVAMYTLPALVTSGLLVLIVQKGSHLTLGTGVLAATGLMLLPLCNAGGVVFLGPLGLWFGYVGFRSWRIRHKEGVWTSLAVLGGVFIAYATAILCFAGYERNSHLYEENPHLVTWERLEASLSAASSAFGSIFAEKYWPYDGRALLVFSGISLCILLLTAVREHSKTRTRAVGLLCFLCASCSIALALGLGRGGGQYGLVFGYTLLPVPILLGLYFVWGLATPRAVGFWAQACLLAVSFFAASVNISTKLPEARERHAAEALLQNDLQNGCPPYQVLARYTQAIGHQGLDYEGHAMLLEMLRETGWKPYRYLQKNPPFREVRLTLEPFVPQNGAGPAIIHFMDPECSETFTLAEPLQVAFLRVDYEIVGSASPSKDIMSVSWKGPSDADFSRSPRLYVSPAEHLAIADRIEQVRLFGNPSFEYRISAIVLLVPEE